MTVYSFLKVCGIMCVCNCTLAIFESSLTLGSFKHCDFGILHSQSLRYQFHLVLVCYRCNVLFAKINYWEVMQLFYIWFLDDAADTNFESSRPASIRDLHYEEACNRIAVEAVKRGCTDNVTVMIVDIMQSPWHKLVDLYSAGVPSLFPCIHCRCTWLLNSDTWSKFDQFYYSFVLQCVVCMSHTNDRCSSLPWPDPNSPCSILHDSWNHSLLSDRSSRIWAICL